MLRALMKAKEVHVLSCPYDGEFSGPTWRAFEIKGDLLHKSPDAFVFDPNTEMLAFALSRFYDNELQSKRWLEIWAELALVVQEMRQADSLNESAFHFLCCQQPPGEEDGEYQWELWEKSGLKGNAQHGELRIAVLAGSKGKSTGLNFHYYEDKEKPSNKLEEEDRFKLFESEREARDALAFQHFLISSGCTEAEVAQPTQIEELAYMLGGF